MPVFQCSYIMWVVLLGFLVSIYRKMIAGTADQFQHLNLLIIKKCLYVEECKSNVLLAASR